MRDRRRFAQIAALGFVWAIALGMLVAEHPGIGTRSTATQPPRAVPVVPAVVDLRIVPQVGHSTVISLAFSEDCRLLASAGDRNLDVWDTALGLLRATWPTEDEDDVDELEWSQDAVVLMSWSSQHPEPRLWDARTGGTWKGSTPTELGPWFDPQAAAKRNVRAGWEVDYSTVHYSAAGRMVAFDLVRFVEIWDGRRERRVATLREEPNGWPSWSRDGRRFAFAIPTDTDDDSPADVRVWDRGSWKTRTVFHGSVGTFALSPDGRNLVVSGSSVSPGFEVIDARSGRSLARMEDGRGDRLAFCPSGRLLAAGGEGGDIQIWDVERRALLRTLPGQRDEVEQVAFSADGRWLLARVSASDEESRRAEGQNAVHVWGLGDGRIQATLRTILGQLAWSPDGLLVSVDGGDLRWWRPENGTAYATLAGRHRSVALGPDSRSVASASWDGSVQIWDARTGKPRLALAQPDGRVVQIAWSAACNRLIAATDRRVLNAWDAGTGKWLADIPGSTDPVIRSDDRHGAGEFVLSLDGRTVAVGLDDRSISLIDVQTWTERATRAIPCDHNSTAHMALSPDGETLAVAGCDETIIQFWNTSTGDLRMQLPARDRFIRSIAYHPSGSTIAIAGSRGLRLHRLSDGASVTLTAIARSDGKAAGLVTAEDGRWGGNPEVSGTLRLRRAGDDLRVANILIAEPLPRLGWRPSLLPDLVAGRP